MELGLADARIYRRFVDIYIVLYHELGLKMSDISIGWDFEGNLSSTSRLVATCSLLLSPFLIFRHYTPAKTQHVST